MTQVIDEQPSKINDNKLKLPFYNEGFQQRLDSNTESILFRVIQEYINNTIKHTGTTKLDISMMNDIDGISITIEDNGKGLEQDRLTEEEGIGLKNTSSRIQFLNGNLEFNTKLGKGILIAIHVPLQIVKT